MCDDWHCLGIYSSVGRLISCNNSGNVLPSVLDAAKCNGEPVGCSLASFDGVIYAVAEQ